MASIRKPLLLSFAEKYSTTLIHLGSTVILARLLTPAEIGIFSVSIAFVAIWHALRDFGVTNYLIQKKDVTLLQIRGAFGVSLLIAWAMAILLWTSSDLLALFYEEPGMHDIILIFAVNFFLLPFSSIAYALLRRDMRFGALYVINTANAVMLATVSIVLAYLGWGYMSLAWGNLAATVTTVIVSYIYRPDLLGLLPSRREIKPVLSFGMHMSTATIAAELGTSAPDLVMGRLLGFDAVGFFSRAKGLVGLFGRFITKAITPVALPAFAQMYRDGEDLRGPYLRSVSYLTVFAWPFFSFVSIWTAPIIHLMFGDQWGSAIPIARILCLSTALSILIVFVTPLLTAAGEPKKIVAIQLVVQPISVALIIAAAFHSLEMVAVIHIFIALIYSGYAYRHVYQMIGVGLLDALRASGKSLFVAVVSCVMPAIMLGALADDSRNNPLMILAASVLLGMGWLLGIFLSRHPVKTEVYRVWQAAWDKCVAPS